MITMIIPIDMGKKYRSAGEAGSLRHFSANNQEGKVEVPIGFGYVSVLVVFLLQEITYYIVRYLISLE